MTGRVRRKHTVVNKDAFVNPSDHNNYKSNNLVITNENTMWLRGDEANFNLEHTPGTDTFKTKDPVPVIHIDKTTDSVSQ